MEDLSAAIFNLTNGNEDHIEILEEALDKYLKTKSGVAVEKSEFQVTTGIKEAEKEEVDTLLENIIMPPDFTVDITPQFIRDLFESEAQVGMRERRVTNWLRDHGENWTRLMEIAEAEKPVQFMKTDPIVKHAKAGARTVETPAYKEWKAKWWKYVKHANTARKLIEASQQQ